MHGEADLIASLGPGPVLDAGCGTGRVAIELARRGIDVLGVDLDPDMVAVARAKAPRLSWLVADLATMQLDRRFPIVAMAGNVLLFARPADHRLIVHTLASHLEPGGRMVAGFSLEPGGLALAGYDELCRSCGLVLDERWSTWDRQPFVAGGGYHVSVHRRTERETVHDLLAAARQEVPRLTPEALRGELAADPEMVVLDTRTPTDRDRFGVIAGSVHAPRTVLEWAVDPASGYHHPAVTGLRPAARRRLPRGLQLVARRAVAAPPRLPPRHRPRRRGGRVAGRRPAPRGAGPRAHLLGALDVDADADLDAARPAGEAGGDGPRAHGGREPP